MTKQPAFRWACWTATSFLTLAQATARSAVAASISQRSRDSARFRTGLGSSPDSKHVSMSPALGMPYFGWNGTYSFGSDRDHDRDGR